MAPSQPYRKLTPAMFFELCATLGGTAVVSAAISRSHSRSVHAGHPAVAVTSLQLGGRHTGRASAHLPRRKVSTDEVDNTLRKELVPSDGQIDPMRTVATSLRSVEDIEYVGPIGVGTAQRPAFCTSAASITESDISGACARKEQASLAVVFDTGSTNLWMSSDLCKTDPCTKDGRNRYDHTLSETYVHPAEPIGISVKFGTAELKGWQAIDDFHIGPFTVKDQTFNMIEEEIGSTFSDLPLEGIVGLAFPSMLASKGLPFFDTVIKQKVLKHNEFAFYFSSGTHGSSAILWGGVDPQLYEGEMRMFPVTQAHYWAIDLHDLKIGDSHVNFHDAQPLLSLLARERTPKLIFDSGTTYFAMNSAAMQQILKVVPSHEVPCSDVGHLPNLVFKLKDAGGEFYDLVVNASEYMIPILDGSAICNAAFMEVSVPDEYGPAVLVGETFMRLYVTVFDRGDGSDSDARVGFARAARGPAVDSNLLRLTGGVFSEEDAQHTPGEATLRRTSKGVGTRAQTKLESHNHTARIRSVGIDSEGAMHMLD